MNPSSKIPLTKANSLTKYFESTEIDPLKPATVYAELQYSHGNAKLSTPANG